MDIVIIGDGKVGHKIVRQLSDENDNVVLIDQSEEKLKNSINELDISCIVGNGASAEIQKQAGVPEADLVIACASTDELNMLCCLLARRLGAKKTIARVRSPLYYQQIHLLREDLKLSLAVNPDQVLAEEISRVLIFPSAAKIEVFAKGRVELVEVLLGSESKIAGLSLAELYRKYQIKLLICAVQREQEVFIPDGSFVLRVGDKIHIASSHKEIERFFKTVGAMRNRVRTVLIGGGGRTAYYLAARLIPLGMQVKIIEQNQQRCEELCDLLPKATIIHGDASDHSLLEEEGLENADAFVSLTGIDEENIIMSMYAKARKVSKVITKINEEGLREMVEEMGMESVVSAKDITANMVLSYVRAMKNSMGSANVETMYRLIGDKVEALEFWIKEKTSYTGIPLKDLPTRENHLVACIVRKRQIIIPGGNDTLEMGDSVIVICKGRMMDDLKDILA
ncbi:MAG: Trk system potassium transporter TrkA [Lachnospiraceae bacterium]|nr:Trk system potassium transporter TrkA [Lachnospiraceae bacterium]